MDVIESLYRLPSETRFDKIMQVLLGPPVKQVVPGPVKEEDDVVSHAEQVVIEATSVNAQVEEKSLWQTFWAAIVYGPISKDQKIGKV